jgi:hypothetical protein
MKSANGIGETTGNSPVPDKLRELERRISVALTEAVSAHDLANLLQHVDDAIPTANELAKLETEKSLDPLQSPDPHAARQQAEDATFMASRLRALRPRVLQRRQQIAAQEEIEAYQAKMAQFAPERDALEQELADTYQEAAGKLVDLFARLRAFQQRAREALGNPPANVAVLQPIKAQVLDKVQLFGLDGNTQLWPPPNNFAAEYVQSMFLPPCPGAAWSDPAFQERRRIEIESEQRRIAVHHEQTSREQEEQRNREERERFTAAQRR